MIEVTAPLLRRDLQEALRRRGIDPLTLGVLPRVLLTTDGTVTDILEAYLGEPMQVVKLSQAPVALERPLPWLGVVQGHEVLSRKILLQGAVSRRNVLYAESLIVMDRLDQRMRTGLLECAKPIGQLLLEGRVETLKEIVDCGREEAGSLAAHFALAPTAPLLFRTYQTFAHDRPVMLITEKFPCELLLPDP